MKEAADEQAFFRDLLEAGIDPVETDGEGVGRQRFRQGMAGKINDLEPEGVQRPGGDGRRQTAASPTPEETADHRRERQRRHEDGNAEQRRVRTSAEYPRRLDHAGDQPRKQPGSCADDIFPRNQTVAGNQAMALFEVLECFVLMDDARQKDRDSDADGQRRGA
jgi:hypothetical protein